MLCPNSVHARAQNWGSTVRSSEIIDSGWTMFQTLTFNRTPIYLTCHLWSWVTSHNLQNCNDVRSGKTLNFIGTHLNSCVRINTCAQSHEQRVNLRLTTHWAEIVYWKLHGLFEMKCNVIAYIGFFYLVHANIQLEYLALIIAYNANENQFGNAWYVCKVPFFLSMLFWHYMWP